ncbi:hypothetical protein DFQ26_007630 [Actinomortierella ambigua]|nr:hypothetical protein DFQ26_007630 [Actinomortierella ambigua]
MTSFVLGNQIGSGGFGSVYCAMLGSQQCAAKECFASYADLSSSAVKKEIDILQQLRHRHIIQYLETLEHNGHIYILMDLAEKGSLAGAIARGEVTDWVTKNRIANEVARGLEYIHRREILHRDLKTANVLLTQFMQVKLCDFGLAKVKTISASASSDFFKGTPRWAAPEVTGLRPHYTPKSDVYALGLVMWAMAANRPEPFSDQQSTALVVDLVQRGDREEIPSDTPPAYQTWIERCWHQDPNQRPNAQEVVLVQQQQLDTTIFESPGSVLELTFDGSIRDRLAIVDLGDAIGKLSLADGLHDGNDSIDDNDDSNNNNNNNNAISQPRSKDDVVIRHLRQLATVGDAEAQLVLGWMCDHHHAAAGTVDDAPLWYRKAAEQGHSTAQLKLARLYESKFSSDPAKNDAEAAPWYAKAAEGGDAHAQLRLGLFYARGRGQLPKSNVDAARWFERAAEQGLADAQYNIGLMYSRGVVVEKGDADNGDGEGGSGDGLAQDDAASIRWMRLAADQDLVDAQFGLGSMYKDGRGGVDPSDENAALWYRRAAERGHAVAQLHLGMLLFHRQQAADEKSDNDSDDDDDDDGEDDDDDGHNIENYKESLEWIRKSANQDNSDAQVQLGIMYDSGYGIADDKATAVSWYRKAAAQGNARAQVFLGIAYEKGHAVPQDHAEALSWFRKAADSGNAEAQRCMGVMYINGHGPTTTTTTTPDDPNAKDWLTKAALGGNLEAQVDLGVMYELGCPGIPQDHVEAAACFRKAADQGSGRAYAYLGLAYQAGRGVEKNQEEAIKLFHKANDLGYVEAAVCLGLAYEDGRGVEPDYDQAADWYLKAAEQGNLAACLNIAALFELGFGVTRNKEQALSMLELCEEDTTTVGTMARMHIEWLKSSLYQPPKNDSGAVELFRQGAEQGYAAAQNNLGRMYEVGCGVKKDRQQAMQWLRKAAEQGHDDAKERLKDLQATLGGKEE